MKSGVSLSLLVLAFTVSTSEANYEFTVHFYEFRNPLGLQCGACESGGPPACCDDVNRTENCINENNGPLRCDTRFRFTLRPYEALVETAPDKFPHFNFMPNSITFTEGPQGFNNLQNPYTITNASKWTRRVQFFIDALDRVVPHRASLETEAIINRFPIDLELELGANFTERTTYTGIYNISGLGFDMSFRVQCSENYYGPDCTTFCEGMYTCDSEERAICIQNPATNCTTSFPQFTGETGSTKSSDGGESDALVAGAVGGTSVTLIIILLILCILIVIVMKVKQKGKHHSTTVDEGMHDELSTSQQVLPPQMKTVTMDTDEHDLNNPLYAEGAEDPVTDVKNGNLMSPSTGFGNGIIDPVRHEYPQDGILDVPSHCPDGKFSGEANVLSSYSQNSLRMNTFPYVMENAPQASDSIKNTSPRHQNVHGSHTTMNKPGTDSITMTSGLPTSEHNDREYEYDVLERCNTTLSQASPAVPRSVANPLSSDGSLVYSLATEPMEGEVYNVAYPVLTLKAESRVVVDAAYECLSNIY